MMNEDRTFIEQKIDSQSASLPQNLSAAAVAGLVAGQAQKKKPRSRAVPVLASLAAVFVLLIGVAGGMRIFGGTRNITNLSPARPTESAEAPEVTQPAVDPAAYDALAALLQKNVDRMPGVGYRYESSLSGYIRGFFNKSAESDMAPAESVEGSTAMPAAVAPEATAENAAKDYNASHSSLNTRTEGVDETDVIRTNGKHVFVLKGQPNGYYGRYRVFAPVDYAYGGGKSEPQRFIVIDPANGQMKTAGEYALSLSDENAKEITRERTFNGFYLYGDYAVLTGSEMRFTEGSLSYNEEYGYWDFSGNSKVEYQTVALILDCSDPGHITPVKELFFDGDQLDTRIIGSRLLTVSRFIPESETFNPDDYKTFVPRSGVYGAYLPADRIHVADENASAYVLFSLTDLNGGFATESVAVLGGTDSLYVSGENAYCYGMQYEETGKDNWQDFLCVSKVDITGNTPVFKATGKYKGVSLFDEYAIDEYNGMLRMAVESNGFTDAFDNWIPSRSYVVVTDGALNVIGQSKSFGENEDIRSVRFMGEKAYVVTFRQTDPLFAFDLSDPKNPVITGEVKLPGFSAYMHPAGEGYMLGIGDDGTEDGTNGDAKISLFSVADPENPVEVDRIVLENAVLDTDHKRFLTRGENGFIVCFSQWNENYEDYTRGAVYLTAENGKLTLRQKIVIPEEVYENRAVFIGENLFCYTVRTAYDKTLNENTDDYWNSAKTVYELYSFDLRTGGAIAHITL